MPRVVVLGTGTNVGKTYVTAALCRALGKAEARSWVAAAKPIETGIAATPDGSPPGGSDAETLEAASRAAARPHPLYAFPDGISPHLAARRVGQAISLAKVRAWANRIDRTALHDTTLPWVFFETAGGAFSPVTARATNVDLALALDPAIWVLVAPDALGVLHDVRATLTALSVVGREPDFLVLSAARDPDASSGSNADELPKLGLPRPIAVVPRGGDAARALEPLARALLDLAAAPVKPPRRTRSGRVRA